MAATVQVPAPFTPLFDKAEEYVRALFSQYESKPGEGTIHVGGERYVLVRAQSLHMALFDQLTEAFGEQQANEFIYNMARIIGRADCESFSAARKVTDPTERLSAGPVHFAFAGWARVHILEDSSPTPDDNYFLHYVHPNTFESEVIERAGRKVASPACFFSAGYSAGWCSAAYGIEVHARELTCTASGHERCEFIMAPFERLDEHQRRLG